MQLKDATLLIAEDEPAIRDIFKNWFEREGCRVLAAEDGLQALELVRNNRVDLILSDVRMPGMDGITLARQINEMRPYFPKIMFISGFSDILDRDSYDLGIEVTLAKPIRRKDLVAIVANRLADNLERWAEPPEFVPQQTLARQFASLKAAQLDGSIAFGRGGFCLASTLIARIGEPLGLQLDFAAEARSLTGQGLVRWTAPSEGLVGIEISAITPEALEWVVTLCDRNATNSFIPRTALPGRTGGA